MKRGNTYSVRYTYTDHHGKPCQSWVSFKSKKEALERKIAVEKTKGKAPNPTIQRFLSGAPRQSISEPFPFAAASVASSKETVSVPSL